MYTRPIRRRTPTWSTWTGGDRAVEMDRWGEWQWGGGGGAIDRGSNGAMRWPLLPASVLLVVTWTMLSWTAAAGLAGLEGLGAPYGEGVKSEEAGESRGRHFNAPLEDCSPVIL